MHPQDRPLLRPCRSGGLANGAAQTAHVMIDLCRDKHFSYGQAFAMRIGCGAPKQMQVIHFTRVKSRLSGAGGRRLACFPPCWRLQVSVQCVALEL